MRGTLFFVHGTGVRKPGFEKTIEKVQDGARRNGITGVDIVGCSWGQTVGVSHDLVDATLPREAATKAAFGQPVTDDELDIALWAILREDPVFELRLVSETAPAATRRNVVVGELRADQAAIRMVKDLRVGAVPLDGTGLTPEDLTASAAAIAAAPELAGAARAVGTAIDPDLVRTVARAVVAQALSDPRFDEPGGAPAAAVNGDVRDGLVRGVEDVLVSAGTKGNPTDWIRNKAIQFALPRVFEYGREHREALMTRQAAPFAGDVVFYLRRSEAISDEVERKLVGLRRPVVAVGHSLGGIVLVDLLSRPNPPLVDLLVTAGSQAPILFALDAMATLRPKDSSVKPFTPWLNIYNRNDLISFCAARVFIGVKGITDVEVNPRVPAKDAHSAYWDDDRVYQFIKTHWPAGGDQ